MVLTDQEKASNKRNKMIEKVTEKGTGKYISKFVAPDFQRMIRAEVAAQPVGTYPAIVDDELTQVHREVGQCVCVTCGKVQPWSGGDGGGMNAGHFLASRRNSIIFEEDNVWPQCTRCNTFEGGNPQAYQLWMELVLGQEVIDRLRKLKETRVTFTKDEIVDMRIGYMARLKVAEAKMIRPAPEVCKQTGGVCPGCELPHDDCNCYLDYEYTYDRVEDGDGSDS